MSIYVYKGIYCILVSNSNTPLNLLSYKKTTQILLLLLRSSSTGTMTVLLHYAASMSSPPFPWPISASCANWGLIPCYPHKSPISHDRPILFYYF